MLGCGFVPLDCPFAIESAVLYDERMTERDIKAAR
jgi:hypothetical protein